MTQVRGWLGSQWTVRGPQDKQELEVDVVLPPEEGCWVLRVLGQLK